METEGVFAPATIDDARAAYEAVGPAARVVVRETARAMSFDAEEYDDRVTGRVVETARDALFASLLEVHIGSRSAFEQWCEANSSYEPDVIGSENVDRVVWHPISFADAVVAATFQHEPEAAAGTLRRRAFGRYYRDRL